MATRTLGDKLTVPSIGLGCMGMSHTYGTADDEQSVRVLHRALDVGITHFDSSDAYGAGHNEELLGRALKGRREQAVLATKFGITRLTIHPTLSIELDNRPEYVHAACDASLRRLDTDYIDLYYLHRRDSSVPIEETVGAMGELVASGKVRFLGLSEVGAEALRRAHATHPITALQSEWSLWERGIEDSVLPMVRDLGIGIVPWAPLGRGFLAGTFASLAALPEKDHRRADPRFQGPNLTQNQNVVLQQVREAARASSCTPAQLALAWLLYQGPDIVPIPGTTNPGRLKENVAAATIELTPETLSALDTALPAGTTAGPRYPHEAMKVVGA
ncbi:General stress protein 69 (plasmid) [Streptomyces sp. YIM 121038]|uniref:aldo/keto reductase n=1 Tax=Streptomyces sp. YIM 121038 TaxID=2136401 RepID=UPI0011100AB5|nr:aldo/keto reductase [Streptomyces sp. YIM 121038]QCX82946.1 General stress protein 69 [Streptomyces sp. YIM 121038]